MAHYTVATWSDHAPEKATFHYCQRIDAAKFMGHRLVYAAAEARGLRDRPVAWTALRQVYAFKGELGADHLAKVADANILLVREA